MTRSFLPSLFGNDKSDTPAFHSLHKEIDRVFDEFKGLVPRFDSGRLTDFNGQIVPRLDVSETDETVEITAELPGVGEDDVDISVSSNVLTLKGEKSAQKEEKEKDFHVVERSYGKFARTIPLSFDINPDDVDAKFTDGVLAITITKPPEIASKTRKIAINRDK